MLKIKSVALICFDKVSVILGGGPILDGVEFVIRPGETWAIAGHSGSGKSMLARAMTGAIFHHGEIRYEGYDSVPSIAYVPQEHQFRNRQNTNDLYYQQRFNATESDDSMVVSEVIGSDSWSALLQLEGLMNRPLLQLSNGENKRLQLAAKLQSDPQIVILDNPYLGLDAAGRGILDAVLVELVSRKVEVVLIHPADALPGWITHVAVLEHGRLVYAGPKSGLPEFSRTGMLSTLPSASDLNLYPTNANFEFAVKMKNVHVGYGTRPILDGINWEVRKGECWNLSGPNGAGKSTLLSLITGDNPQAYSNEIYLFDRRRGSGESIWDIKKQIGFVSPELHLYFNQSSTCEEVIGSGYFDTIGLFRVLSDSQQDVVSKWIQTLHLDTCRYKPLHQMSRGEQRLALLARALVKSPPLLILDEPTQGLDHDQILLLKHVVKMACNHFGTTLIYVSHYTDDIPTCVTRYLKLLEGKVV